MKRVMLMMVLAALLLTQCKKPSIEFPTPSVTTTVSMTITAGPGSKTDISTEGGIVWSANDKIYVGNGSEYVGYLTIVSGVGNPTGTFTGDVTATAGNNKTFHFYYLGNAKDYREDLGSNNKSVVVDFSSQDIHADGRGNLTNASKHHVGYGKAEHVTVEAGQPITGLQVSMKSKVAIAYFCFKDGESATPYTGALTLKGDNIYNKMTVNFSADDFNFTYTNGEISLTNTTTYLKYAMLVPPYMTAAETLNFGGVIGGTGSTTFENGIEANKFYRIDGDKPIEVTLTYETVNMGLPAPYANLEWSKYNLGVNPLYLNTLDNWCGDYYAWGETAPYYQNGSWCAYPSHDANITFEASVGYGWKNYLDGKSNSWVEKLDWKPYGEGTTLTSKYDAATQKWGSDWRMPTKEEWEELCKNENTTIERVTNYNGHNGVNGWLFKSKKDSSKELFFPAAGKYDGASRTELNDKCFCWSSEVETDAYGAHGTAWALSLGQTDVLDVWNRTKGYSVRPVRAAR